MGHFYFVRHGQTIWNVENKICGATDIALTEFGHQQAVETGEKILKEGIQADEILYSPLVRAADTAKHISEMTGIPARPEPRLTEQNFGKWESTARVARNSGNREAFDIVVIEGCGNADIIRKITEAGTENQCDFRLEIDLGAEALVAFHQFFVNRVWGVAHRKNLLNINDFLLFESFFGYF